MVWADDHLTRHRAFVCTVLAAIHDDGSHTAEGQPAIWLARLQGHGTVFRLRMRVAEYMYLGIQVGQDHAALASAMEVWSTMPPPVL